MFSPKRNRLTINYTAIWGAIKQASCMIGRFHMFYCFYYVFQNFSNNVLGNIQKSNNLLTLFNRPFVFIMCSNPNPNKILFMFYSKRSKIHADSNRPKFTYFLEMKRRMGWICF